MSTNWNNAIGRWDNFQAHSTTGGSTIGTPALTPAAQAGSTVIGRSGASRGGGAGLGAVISGGTPTAAPLPTSSTPSIHTPFTTGGVTSNAGSGAVISGGSATNINTGTTIGIPATTPAVITPVVAPTGYGGGGMMGGGGGGSAPADNTGTTPAPTDTGINWILIGVLATGLIGGYYFIGKEDKKAA
jgi:hypothetical protein